MGPQVQQEVVPLIISASRRTDIPAWFSDWFLKRISEGHAYVRNPMNAHQVSKINLSPDVVDCIVFWSKNPAPILDKLDQLGDYMYYFQYTLNAYGTDLESNLPALDERVDTFLKLSDRLGKQRVIWRYDPMAINENYTAGWHVEQFSKIAERLDGYADSCTISFIDLYSSIKDNLKNLGIRKPSQGCRLTLAKELSSAARSHGMTVSTCAEDIDLSLYHMEHARCIDGCRIEKLLGCPINIGKDRNQRPGCGCAESIDLGFYNTCQNGCVYCYATHSSQLRKRNFEAYDVNSPLLCSQVTELDKITERKMKSLRDTQLSMF